MDTVMIIITIILFLADIGFGIASEYAKNEDKKRVFKIVFRLTSTIISLLILILFFTSISK